MPKIPAPLKEDSFRFIRVKQNGKRPIDNNWQENNNYKFNDPELTNHIEQGGNYGVVGGYGNLVIIDADQKKVEHAVEAELPPTLKVRSGGGGAHYYFLCPDLDKPIRLTDNEKGDLGDVQAQGKQVVGPTSNHPSGGTYQLEQINDIAQVTAAQIRQAVNDFTKNKQEKAKKQEQQQFDRHSDHDYDLTIQDVVRPDDPQQRGNEIQGSHPVHGSSTGHNFCINAQKNTWHCFRHGTGGGPLMWIAVEHGIIGCEEAQPGALQGDRFKKTLEIAQSDYGVKVERPSKKDQIINQQNGWDGLKMLFEDGDVKKLEAVKEVGEYLLDEYNFKTPMDSEQLWIFKNPVYEKNGEQCIKERVHSELGPYIRRRDIGEIVDYIKSQTYFERPLEPKVKKYVPVKNGWYNLEKGELQDPDPDYFMTNEIDVEYDPDVDTTPVIEFVREIVKDEDVALIQEMFGYCLYRGYPKAKAFMLHGEGGNGKSTLLKLLTEFLGQRNIATPSLQELMKNRFAKAELYGKLANVHGDLSPTALKETGPFKMLTGDDPIQAERKRQDPFQFKNYAKLIYSANELPYTKDTTEAFFRRWIIIKFPYQFTEDEDDGHKDKDPEVLESLLTEQGLQATLKWALQGLERLMENDWQFSTSDAREQIKQKWLTQTNPLEVFVEQHCEFGADVHVPKDDFVEALNQFCERNGAATLKKQTVTKRLPELVPSFDTGKPSVDGDRVRTYKGLYVVTEEYRENVQPVRGNSNVVDTRARAQGKTPYTESIDDTPGQPGHNAPDETGVELNNQKVLEIIGNLETDSDDDGVSYETIFDYINADESKVEEVVTDLLREGDIFEVKPGRVKTL